MVETLLYLKPFAISFVLTIIGCSTIIFFDKKGNKVQKHHLNKKNVSRNGGIAIILASIGALLIDKNFIVTQEWQATIYGAAVILLYGIIDDRLSLNWRKQMILQICAATIVVLIGISTPYNNEYGLIMTALWGIVWIVLFMNTVNWLDGIDGASAGVTAITMLMIFFISIKPEVYQPPIGIISIIVFGSILAFLIFNWYPAKITAGTSGSMFMGFIISVLAIIAGAKVASIILVLTIPIVDALWVIATRLKNNRSIFKPDQNHLHHKFLQIGWSERKISIVYICITACVAGITLNISATGKIILFSLIVCGTIFTRVVLSLKLSFNNRFSLCCYFLLILGSLFLVQNEIKENKLRAIKIFSGKTVELKINDFVTTAEIVKTPEERQKGLSGREKLCNECSMLFLFPYNGVHHMWMIEMNFPLDIVWVDGKTIVHKVENVQPCADRETCEMLVTDQSGDKVLEIPSGTIKKYNIKIGDRVKVSGN